ncbi:glycosyltransferase family A protein [Flavobacterium sp. ASV13]|uniref:glycosyltransferase family A protein n=1 Tax=Flavobacterium sp. ASV13 TaxID=1506583 RepID=UPI000554D08E|nr:glycosyltransferase family A protein [Flavobacterium sp. ASV13]
MRKGVNPEKFKEERNIQKYHRVLVVCYIPNVQDDYYKESVAVLEKSLNSLINTINLETTSITFINNNSTVEVDDLIKGYLLTNQIDKYVLYNENRGKVYAVIDEVRSVFEPYVTIADCDVLFLNNWEDAVFSVFKNNPKAGVVSPLPCPGLALYLNENIFSDLYLFGGIKYTKEVTDYDIDLYVQGVNNFALINRENKSSWKEKQYIVKRKNSKAVVGASHFVATYKSFIFKGETSFPEIKFKNGYEQNFIDVLASKKGLYRLSTIKTHAYHIGNKLDDFTLNYQFLENDKQHKVNFSRITPVDQKTLFHGYIFKKIVFKFLNKLFKF